MSGEFSATAWYVAQAGGQARGPLTRAQLLALHTRGEIGDETLVWSLEWSEWAPLRRLSGGPGHAPVSGSAAAAAFIPKPVVAKPDWTRGSVPRSGEHPSARPSAPVIPAPKLPSATQPGSASALAALVALRESVSAPPQPIGQPTTEAGARLLTGVRRFLARAFDLALLGGIGFALLHLVVWHGAGEWWPSLGQIWQGWTIVALVPLGLVLLPLEMLWTATGVPTPGKLLFGLRLRRGRSARLGGLEIALRRPGLVLARGQALLIPVLSLVAIAAALRSLLTRGFCDWDEQLGTTVEAGPLSAQRWLFALFALSVVWSLAVSGSWHLLLREFF